MRSIPVLALCVVAVAGATAIFRSSTPDATFSLDGWHSDIDSAMSVAKQSNKPILIDFVSDTCPPCLQMERESFPAKPVQTTLSQYVRVKLRLDDKTNKSFEKYGVDATPTLVVLKSDGTEAARNSGFLAAEDLEKFLRKAL